MCIRDRGYKFNGRIGNAPVQFNIAAYKVIVKDAQRALYAPVSYTHLRAHETVLDLVCRLLLETQKYKVQQQSVLVIHITQNNDTLVTFTVCRTYTCIDTSDIYHY